MVTHFEKWTKQIIDNNQALHLFKQREPYITKAFKELLEGYTKDTTKILKAVKQVNDHPGLVCEKNISFQSMCQHHFLPFYGTIDVIYEPGEILVGLGKISRLVHAFAKRLQFQEQLTKQIAQEFMQSGKAKGVYVRSQAKHLCMAHRGPNDQNAQATCFIALGSLASNEKQGKISYLLGE